MRRQDFLQVASVYRILCPSDYGAETNIIISNQEEIRKAGCRPIYRQRLVGRLPQLQACAEVRDIPPDFVSTGGFMLVSRKLRTLMEEFHVASEYFPVEVTVNEESHHCSGDIFFANVFDEVDCLHPNIAHFSLFKGNEINDELPPLELDETKAVGHHLFFLARASGPIFIASPDFQNAVADRRISGIKFIDPEHY